MAGAFKPDRERILAEMVEEIRDWGTGYSDMKAINVEKWQLAERTFDRYWTEASQRYLAASQSEQKAKDDLRIQMETEAFKSKILTRLERMEILSEIARGEIPLTKHIVCDGVIQEREVVPAWMDRKAALAELNKMDGEYAPIRKDITSGGEQLPAPVFKIILDDPEDGEL